MEGASSVLYDAVAIVVGADAVAALAHRPAARDFVTNAFAHCKFMGYAPEALPLFDAVGLRGDLDDGCIDLGAQTANDFVSRCGELRYWARSDALVGVG